MSLPFRAAHRLRSRVEFTAVQEQGRRVSGRFATVLGRPNDGPGDRLGIIASRKVGGSVVRNRAKRRIREVFRLTAPAEAGLRGLRGFDFVVIARRELPDAPYALIAADLCGAMRKLRGSAVA